MTGADVIKLVIVDDHPIYADAVASGLGSGFDVVSATHTLGDCIAYFERGGDADLVLADLQLPDGSGVDVVGAVAELSEDPPPVCIISASTETAHLREALDAGVIGFVNKASCSIPDLRRCLRQAAAGQEVYDPDTASRAVAMLRERNRTSEEPWTERDLKIVELAAAGYSNAEIANELSYAESSVKSYISRIVSRLGVQNRAHMVAESMRRGLIR